jgi:hypothetical protein
MKLGFPCGVL